MLKKKVGGIRKGDRGKDVSDYLAHKSAVFLSAFAPCAATTHLTWGLSAPKMLSKYIGSGPFGVEHSTNRSEVRRFHCPFGEGGQPGEEKEGWKAGKKHQTRGEYLVR